jgi:predicted nucleic acid-binding protein
VTLVLDASVAVAWLLARSDPEDARLAQLALQFSVQQKALIPSLWFTEVANALLVAERRRICTPEASALFLADLDALPITVDDASPHTVQVQSLSLARTSGLTAYDAIYLELARRKKCSLATFDRKLAEAFRNAGGHVFGDPALSDPA